MESELFITPEYDEDDTEFMEQYEKSALEWLKCVKLYFDYIEQESLLNKIR